MVYIKKVEIYGFKSFGYKNTIINLEKGMMCITGPNGSGKSSILDAIAFALGENSPKVLRVDRLNLLFHDITEGRVHKLVRVSVTFDNSDRGIPIDSNTVTITREMPPEGESVYLLNGKQVTKSTITDLLEVALATPNRLNNVQQGMVMRLAELNTEERRKIIEDLTGLSYFDKKKEEAVKQLQEADRRLEVAMARMSEIRKRIDELEQERNNQLRFQHIEKEIKRLKGVKISNMIRATRDRLAAIKGVLEQREKEYDTLSRDLESVKTELEKLEREKSVFMQEVDRVSRSKAEVNTKISNLIVRVEQLRATREASEQRIKTIGNRIPSLMKERYDLEGRLEKLSKEMDEQIDKSRIVEENKKELNDEMKRLNARISEMSKKLSEVSEKERKLESELKKRESILMNVRSDLASKKERMKILVDNLAMNNNRLEKIREENSNLGGLLLSLKDMKDKREEISRSYDNNIMKLSDVKARLDQDVEEAVEILEKAGVIAARYETKVGMAKSSYGEDFAIAYLAKEQDLNIIGTLQELLRWKKEHERAVMAIASTWMKSLVVNDIRSALRVIERTKQMHLPRVRVIPADIINSLPNKKMNIQMEGVIGRLSDLVSSNIPNLSAFLFSDVILVRSSSLAYELAKKGYRTVTLEGELFEPRASILTLDLGSRLTDLTKMILLGESVEELRNSLSRLRDLVNIKKEESKSLTMKLEELYQKKGESERVLAEISAQKSNTESQVERHLAIIKDLENRVNEAEEAKRKLGNEISELENKEGTLSKEINEIKEAMKGIEKESLSKELDDANMKKADLSFRLESVEQNLREVLTLISSKRAEIDAIKKRLNEIYSELDRVKAEAKERASLIKNSSSELLVLEKELKENRDKEQEIINTSANSVNTLHEYDSRIKILSETERRLTRQLANIEKDLALSKKESNDLIESEKRFLIELEGYGYNELLEGFNVDLELNELVKEYEGIRGTINQLADKSYTQIIDGYRGMSERKNQLEAERNSIVRFIEDIEKEKTKIFMDAFKNVDKDVRHIFSTMTDGLGSAWLEIEDPDNIFGSGLTLLVQFPNKQPRESISLSGGEKTIAAITFLLALQSLKPSPYYLFDEVDAHLDAQNTERLLKIMLERSKMSQIIAVSLKDVIVAYAQLVHGVYARNGVSQVMKYRAGEQISI